MYTFLTASKDATIYLQQPTQNTGLDEILEISKTYYGNLKDVSRSLIKFNTNSISNVLLKYLPSVKIKSKLDEIWSYEEMLKAHGYAPSVQILSVIVEKADEETAVSLNLTPDDEVLVVRKLFLENDEPVILTHNIIPTHLIDGAYTDEDLLLPVYEFLGKNGRLNCEW